MLQPCRETDVILFFLFCKRKRRPQKKGTQKKKKRDLCAICYANNSLNPKPPQHKIERRTTYSLGNTEGYGQGSLFISICTKHQEQKKRKKYPQSAIRISPGRFCDQVPSDLPSLVCSPQRGSSWSLAQDPQKCLSSCDSEGNSENPSFFLELQTMT